MTALAEKIDSISDRLPAWRRIGAFEGTRLITDITDLARVHPNGEARARLHCLAGIVFSRQGLFTEAFEEYAAGLHFAPDDPVLHSNVGVALLHSGRIEDALEQFLRGADIFGDQAWAQVPVLCNVASPAAS